VPARDFFPVLHFVGPGDDVAHLGGVEGAGDVQEAVALEGGNVFEELMSASKICSLGQMSAALYAVGGRYRRNM